MFQETVKQKTVGITPDGVSFPIATQIQLVDEQAYEIIVWVSSTYQAQVNLFLASKFLLWSRQQYFIGGNPWSRNVEESNLKLLLA